MESIENTLIQEANELAKSNYSHDPDNPITTLAEALTMFVVESLQDDSFDNSEIYDLINLKLKSKNNKTKKFSYHLTDNSINGIKINQEIFDNELFEYRIEHRESFIDELTRWISEATKDKELMKTDLKMLLKWKDEYIFSSISTNEYIRQKDSNFDELCKQLLELNSHPTQ